MIYLPINDRFLVEDVYVHALIVSIDHDTDALDVTTNWIRENDGVDSCINYTKADTQP